MGTAGLVVLATSRTWLTCHGSQSETGVPSHVDLPTSRAPIFFLECEARAVDFLTRTGNENQRTLTERLHHMVEKKERTGNLDRELPLIRVITYIVFLCFFLVSF